VNAGLDLKARLGHWSVPILFAVLCLSGILVAKLTPSFLLGEMLVRVSRNSLLVLALVIPILAGLGLNFGIVIGAMAGQAAAIFIVHLKLAGIVGFGAAWLIATPLAIVLGVATGLLFNKAKAARWLPASSRASSRTGSTSSSSCSPSGA